MKLVMLNNMFRHIKNDKNDIILFQNVIQNLNNASYPIISVSNPENRGISSWF